MTALSQRKICTVSEYHKMIDAGVFIGNSNYELIKGEILEKIKVGDYHISCVNRLNHIYAKNFDSEFIVSVHNPIIISEISEPEPDLTVLRFQEDFYASGKAGAEDVLLLIEVSDSTVKYDKDVKIPLYAEAEVSEVWLVNLPKQVIEVYSQPEKGKYKTVEKIKKNQTISPKFMPELKIKVTDILG